MSAPYPVREGWRDGSPAPTCVLCTRPLPSRKARYCSRACQQRAYRLRQAPTASSEDAPLRRDLRRRQALVAHTVYECPTCEERYLGERRCSECHRVCRALGLEGRCPDCALSILRSDLLDREVPT